MRVTHLKDERECDPNCYGCKLESVTGARVRWRQGTQARHGRRSRTLNSTRTVRPTAGLLSNGEQPKHVEASARQYQANTNLLIRTTS